MAPAEQNNARRLESLAEHIADDKEPLWEEVPTPSEADLPVIRGLQTVSKVAAANRAEWPEEDRSPSAARETEAAADTNLEKKLEHWRHLEILDFIDGGAFGSVYRARDPQLDRVVALKLLSPEASDLPEAFDCIEEARNLAKVNDDSVVRVYHAERYGGRVGISMELITGQNLEEILQQQGTWGARQIRGLALDLCPALAAVHKASVLHRDIKTRNVIQEEGTGRIVLTDFGSSLLDNHQSDRSNAGTPVYMAPELFENGRATASSDIYSLGVLLFHLATGTYPVVGETYDQVQRAHREGRQQLLADLRPDLDSTLVMAIERAFAADPQQRYRTAGEFERAIRGDSPRYLWPIVATAAAISAFIGYHLYESSFRVEASLFRVGDTAQEMLLPGATIAEGDHLLLDMKSSKASYAYVINYDDIGRQSILFPMAISELVNPLPRNEHVRLPGTADGEPITWEITGTSGKEHILIVASPNRLEELESLTEHIKEVPLSKQQDNLRAIEKAVVMPNLPLGSVPTSTLLEKVANLASQRRVWVKQVDLYYKTP